MIVKSDVAYWYEMNEGSGTTIVDANGGSSGTLVTDTWTTGGKVSANNLYGGGTAGVIAANRVDSGVSVASSTAYTVFGWWKIASSGSYSHLFGSGGTAVANDRNINIYKNTDNTIVARTVQFGVGNVGLIQTADTWADNNWHFLVFTRDGSGNMRLYIDNVSKGTATDNTAFTAGIHHIGNAYFGGNDYIWYGNYQAWGFLKRGIDATEAGSLWNGGNGITYAAMFPPVTNKGRFFAFM